MDPGSVLFSLMLFVCLLFHDSMPMNTRIVGGYTIDITKVPFMLSLRLNDAHICGATIISKNWGVTAAHCVTTYGTENHRYSVRSGSSFLNKGGRIHNVTSIISHELYNDLNSDYDIAVLRVKQAFKSSKTTRAIDLPGSNYVNDDWAGVAGWGYRTNSDNQLSPQLQYVAVPKIEIPQCAADYAGRFVVTPRQVCYGFEEGGKDACQGDSGGPLFVNNSIIIGVTSWGDDCGAKNSPGVYTTIFLMQNWIYNKTGIKSTL